MLDLKPKYLEMLKAILTQVAPGMEVWAYGSRVSGQSHDMSDLDLVMRNPKDLNQRLPNLIELREAFRDSNLPISVDIMDWARIPQSFRNEILKLHESINMPAD